MMGINPKKAFQKAFIDTSAFIAIADASEQNHSRILEALGLLPKTLKLVTTNFVFDETVTRIRSLLGVDVAYDFAQKLLKLPQYQMITIETKIIHKALELMKTYKDKAFSFTDCTSFVVMVNSKLKYAITLDSDFKKAGFEMIPQTS